MFRNIVLTFTLFLVPMQAFAWTYYTEEDPISGDVYYVAEAFSDHGSEGIGVLCSHEQTGKYLGIGFSADYAFATGQSEYVEYRVGDYSNSSDWIVFNQNMIVVVGTSEVDRFIDELIEGDSAYFRTENANDLMEFDIRGGENEIQRVLNQCN